MNIKKCDICKKNVEFKNYLRVEINAGSFDFVELCPKCAQPITKFLKTKKLIKDEKQNKK